MYLGSTSRFASRVLSSMSQAPAMNPTERYAKEQGCRALFPKAVSGDAVRTLDTLGDADRVIIVGDVHGCLDELQALLEKCSFQADVDTVVLLGDLVGKGPGSLSVLDFAKALPRCHVLLGNHDWTLLRWYEAQRHRNETAVFGSSVGCPYIAMSMELSEEQYAYIKSWPLRIDIPRDNVVCVHAGVDPTLPDPVAGTNGFDMMHIRNVVTDAAIIEEAGAADADGGVPRSIVSEALSGEAWAGLYRGPQHVVFGHDAKRRLQRCEHATGLDTGCCYGNELTALVLPQRDVVSAQSGFNCLQPADGKA